MTRDELRRLQFAQELSNLELRLASVQSEIRTPNHMPSNKVTKQHSVNCVTRSSANNNV